MGWLLRNSVPKKIKECESVFILVKWRQSICLLHAIHWGLSSEDQIVQDGRLAGEHPTWPGCGHFSCLVLSFATNHPAKSRQQHLQVTHTWRMVTSALSMVKFTANNQYVFSGKEPSLISVIGESQAEMISLVTWMHSIFNCSATVAGKRALLRLAFSHWSFLNCHLCWSIKDKCEYLGDGKRRRGKKQVVYMEKLFLSCGWKRGHLLNPPSSGEVHMMGLTHSEAESYHIGWSEHS